jgi:hypothetical protein
VAPPPTQHKFTFQGDEVGFVLAQPLHLDVARQFDQLPGGLFGATLLRQRHSEVLQDPLEIQLEKVLLAQLQNQHGI